MKTIAIVNHKGGVGKTTFVSSIGFSLANEGYNVLLVDADPQASLTNSLAEIQEERTLYEALIDKQNLPIVKLTEKISLVPSSLLLSNAVTMISNAIGRERILAKLLKEQNKHYDYCIVDCPPSLNLLTINALTASQGVIIPLIAEVLPAQGVDTIVSVIDQIKEEINRECKLLAIVFNRWQTRKLYTLIENEIRGKYGNVVCETKVRQNITIASAPAAQKDIFSFSPRSRGAEDFRNLTREILQRI